MADKRSIKKRIHARQSGIISDLQARGIIKTDAGVAFAKRLMSGNHGGLNRVINKIDESAMLVNANAIRSALRRAGAIPTTMRARKTSDKKAK